MVHGRQECKHLDFVQMAFSVAATQLGGFVHMLLMRGKDGSINKLLRQPFALIYCCHLVENVKWVLPGRLNRILQE